MSATPSSGSEWNTLTWTPPRSDSTSTSFCQSRSQRCAVWNALAMAALPQWWPRSDAQVRLAHLGRPVEFAGGALPDHPAVGQDVDQVGRVDGQAVVLLDQEDGQAVPAPAAHDAADLLH